MDRLKNLITVLGSAFSVLATVYGFLLWRDKRRREALLKHRLSFEQAQAFVAPQKKVLEAWRLFDFQRDIRLADIYVQEVFQIVQPGGGTQKAFSPPVHEQDICRQLSQDYDPERRLFVIEGLAGSGKSTMLRSWGLKLLEALAVQETSQEARAVIPIYLALAHLPGPSAQNMDISTTEVATCFQRTIPGLEESLAKLPFERLAEVRSRLQEVRPKKPILLSWLKKLASIWPLSTVVRVLGKLAQRLRKGRLRPPPEWVFLCDGLDELDEHRRAAFLRWTQALPSSSAAVVTTRPEVLRVINFVRAREYRICDFNIKQIGELIDRWFVAKRQLGYLLLSQIQSGKSLRQLAGSPLLLTCLCIDVETRDEPSFPEKVLESELLRRIIEVVLDRWDATKSCRPPNVKLIELAILLFTKLATEHPSIGPISHIALATALHECAVELGLVAIEDAALRRITSGTQLLQGNQTDGYVFKHAVFFDFFLAQGIKRIHNTSVITSSTKGADAS